MASSIDPIKTGIGEVETIAPYVRPADWLPLPTIVATDQKFAGLVAVFDHESNFVSVRATGAYTVDWGDGSAPENIASNTMAHHIYSYAAVAGTECSRGYRQAIVTIVPQAGQTLTNINLGAINPILSVIGTTSTAQWLDVIMAMNNTGTLTWGAPGTGALPRLLEQFNWLGNNAQTTCTYLFSEAVQLRSAWLSTTTVTNFSNMFYMCSALKTIPLLNTGVGTNFTSMFEGCRSLLTIPMINTASATNMTSMFGGCYALQSVPLLNTANVGTFSSMFQNCMALQTIPHLPTGNGTTFSTMFSSCRSLKTIPLLDTSKGTTFTQMFANCTALRTIPLLNLGAATTVSGLFENCSVLESVPLFNTANATNFSLTFNGCTTLRAVPALNTSKGTNFANMLGSCTSLNAVPLFNTALGTDFNNMFTSCLSIQEIPAFNMASATTATGFCNNNNSLSKVGATGCKAAISFAGAELSKSALEIIFSNLGKATGTPAITVSTNYGSDSAVSRSGTLTAGSPTYTIASTTGIAVGQLVTGTGISTAVAVTMTDAGDLINRTAHGLANDKAVSFATIVTTTGIVTFTRYYVVNATANTFQIALTVGGAPIALTGDGSGTLLYGSFVVSLVPNTSVTLDAPASASGAQTLSHRLLNISIATLKGYTVTT